MKKPTSENKRALTNPTKINMLVDRNKTTTSEHVQAEEERSQSAEPPKTPCPGDAYLNISAKANKSEVQIEQ